VAYLPPIEASAAFPLLTLGENVYPPSLAEGGSGDRGVWQAAARKAGRLEGLAARLRDGECVWRLRVSFVCMFVCLCRVTACLQRSPFSFFFRIH
jgi:hypothetical protein